MGFYVNADNDEKIAFFSLLVTTLAWANVDVAPTSHTKTQMATYNRCYDIDMTYFNQCQDVIIAHLHLNKTAKLIKTNYNTKTSDILTPDIIKTVTQKVEGTDFTKLFFSDGSRPIEVFMPIDIIYQKQSINTNIAKELRLSCAIDNDCDVNELENALQEKGL